MITPKSFIVIWQFSELYGIRAQKNEHDGVLESICYHFILFYFIILPHTMNYKQNKNDNK